MPHMRRIWHSHVKYKQVFTEVANNLLITEQIYCMLGARENNCDAVQPT